MGMRSSKIVWHRSYRLRTGIKTFDFLLYSTSHLAMAELSNKLSDIHVEIVQKNNSLLSETNIISMVTKWLASFPVESMQKGGLITKFEDSDLSEHVMSISVPDSCMIMNGCCAELHYHVYRFNSSAPEIQEDNDQQISTHWILPTAEFHGLWESLIYDFGVKDELLNYVSTAVRFSKECVDPNIVSWNRLVLLHGPPGTGKTSLCKALAQKMCIRFTSDFTYGQLIEVNTHSLFSKWFSESGKLVTKMFQNILSLLEDPSVLVIVLLDEVETLARSRSSALNGSEPSDALRVVNAMLTHLDAIKRYPNVLILTTSNITEAIDVALIDRADIKQFIGLPSVEAIYHIYCGCIEELIKANIIFSSHSFLHISRLQHAQECGESPDISQRSMKLKLISEKSIGLSGRSLRKMPFIACSLFVKSGLPNMDEFLDALLKAVEKQWKDVKNLKIHS